MSDKKEEGKSEAPKTREVRFQTGRVIILSNTFWKIIGIMPKAKTMTLQLLTAEEEAAFKEQAAALAANGFNPDGSPKAPAKKD